MGPEYARDEEENFFKRLGKWRSGRRNPSKLHHTEEKDGRPPPPRGAPCPPTPPSSSVYISLSSCPCLCLSVWCRVLSRLASRGLFSSVPPFSMSAPPDSCLLHSVSLNVLFSTHPTSLWRKKKAIFKKLTVSHIVDSKMVNVKQCICGTLKQDYVAFIK